MWMKNIRRTSIISFICGDKMHYCMNLGNWICRYTWSCTLYLYVYCNWWFPARRSTYHDGALITLGLAKCIFSPSNRSNFTKLPLWESRVWRMRLKWNPQNFLMTLLRVLAWWTETAGNLSRQTMFMEVRVQRLCPQIIYMYITLHLYDLWSPCVTGKDQLLRL